jgi:hypothetical protein
MLVKRGKLYTSELSLSMKSINCSTSFIAFKNKEQGGPLPCSQFTTWLVQLRRRCTTWFGLTGGILIPCCDLFHRTAGAKLDTSLFTETNVLPQIVSTINSLR